MLEEERAHRHQRASRPYSDHLAVCIATSPAVTATTTSPIVVGECPMPAGQSRTTLSVFPAFKRSASRKYVYASSLLPSASGEKPDTRPILLVDDDPSITSVLVCGLVHEEDSVPGSRPQHEGRKCRAFL